MNFHDYKPCLFGSMTNPAVRYKTSKSIPYGTDNLFPNKLRDIYDRSPTAISCVGLKADILSKELSLALNNDSIKLEDKLSVLDIGKVCEDVSLFNGFAIFINMNVLGDITNMAHIPFQDVRYANNYYDTGIMLHSRDWSNSTIKTQKFYNYEYVRNILKKDKNKYQELFMSDKLFTGAILYVSIRGGIYPTPKCLSSIESMQAEIQGQIENRACFTNGFAPKMLIEEYSASRTDSEIESRKNYLSKMFTGSDASQVVYVSVAETDPSLAPRFTPIKTDAKGDDVVKRMELAEFQIIKSFEVPYELVSVKTNGLFSNELLLEKSYEFLKSKMQSITDLTILTLKSLLWK